ncbi:hypothetical protein HY572_05730 [Candidatus Micrarchaeota archaeon]|nr:hypothetical protein [Candidatus Micrarchaeota archaeon]
MGNMTLSIPDDLLAKMRPHSEIKWSEIARRAFAKEIEVLDMMDQLLEKSTLTEADVERIGNKLKADIRKRLE